MPPGPPPHSARGKAYAESSWRIAMLATNFPDEDHVHRPIRTVDPDNSPPRTEFIEECRCGAVRLVRRDGVPTCPGHQEGHPRKGGLPLHR